MKKGARTLEGVVVKLSEVNKVVIDGKLHILHCECLKPDLWILDIEPGCTNLLLIPSLCKCKMYPWIQGNEDGHINL